jgi:hypothetical protein
MKEVFPSPEDTLFFLGDLFFIVYPLYLYNSQPAIKSVIGYNGIGEPSSQIVQTRKDKKDIKSIIS